MQVLFLGEEAGAGQMMAGDANLEVVGTAHETVALLEAGISNRGLSHMASATGGMAVETISGHDFPYHISLMGGASQAVSELALDSRHLEMNGILEVVDRLLVAGCAQLLPAVGGRILGHASMRLFHVGCFRVPTVAKLAGLPTVDAIIDKFRPDVETLRNGFGRYRMAITIFGILHGGPQIIKLAVTG